MEEVKKGSGSSDENDEPGVSPREKSLMDHLINAQKLETLGVFAGGIAHDFNNILATISGYSELLREELSGIPSAVEKISGIRAAVSKGSALTSQILAFCRQAEQQKVQLNVYDVLKDTISFIKSSVPTNILIKEKIVMPHYYVFADPVQLFRVFLNLITNALQSMEEKGGVLSVTLTLSEPGALSEIHDKRTGEKKYILIRFRDTGTGMEPAIMHRIFEPFFTTREAGKGTGLGLSVVHGIVTGMGGEIRVSSRKQKGSVFSIYLPVSSGDQSPAPGMVKTE